MIEQFLKKDQLPLGSCIHACDYVSDRITPTALIFESLVSLHLERIALMANMYMSLHKMSIGSTIDHYFSNT